MQLTVLVDNNTLIDKYLTAEPGVCYHLKIDGKTYLFDTGYSDVFLRNAAILGIDISDIDSVIISHGHNDHSWGLIHLAQYLDRTNYPGVKKIKLVAHPNAFVPKYHEDKSIGANLPADSYPSFFERINQTGVYYLTDNLLFLGEIVRSNDFEGLHPIGKTINCCGHEVDDFVIDDSAMVYTSPEGIVIITGCSHSGVCNIIDYAIKVTGDKRVRAVIGGFHLLNAETSTLARTSDYFKQLNAQALYPCHCTGLKAKIALAGTVDIEEVGVGMVLNF
ncbi:MBL fold metallo-hydrolase [Yersinia enterocolitica]|uniref:MBL fold metallo-hydrolase n=1 Tax=Yersinia enterocolitica TaxID=630 RepID=UPI001C8E8078|nr:MBL fold metallo-hydrolase [Yersinia enterocolitica]MBX9488410.1 MBL fold metallo-hydrolase [Yersinia enterocolitica]MBX9493416.1 MBL fold metallo-hydrolase [Yersinia enterocolitica]